MAKRLKWGTIEYLQQLIDEYFEQAQEKGEMPSITGLRIYIDMSKLSGNTTVMISGKQNERHLKKSKK